MLDNYLCEEETKQICKAQFWLFLPSCRNKNDPLSNANNIILKVCFVNFSCSYNFNDKLAFSTRLHKCHFSLNLLEIIWIHFNVFKFPKLLKLILAKVLMRSVKTLNAPIQLILFDNQIIIMPLNIVGIPIA